MTDEVPIKHGVDRHLQEGHESPPCLHPELVVHEFDRMWGDGRVCCKSCGKFLRWFDSG